ncbi:hypothetical protein [Ornithinibacillus halotolerans]|uniref:Uncharacterized protein n=1 Tax=Ornithinibacillus halotolerans TaxID=1274357 RepID=A0A916W4Q4_9BACI|nr:hypothetical protein [Ornithinibacillus halotolerans]GGA65327.1 hypothetical protein GCM10008025_06470 [Ornithinibacillus halotolerans]
MTRVRLLYLYIIVGIIMTISLYLSLQIYPIENTADKVIFIVTVVSIVISFFAFIIAMNTYVSIDSVNRVTQMNGSVLENEDYVTSMIGLLDEYDMADPKEARDAIFDELEKRFTKESKTALEFANNLQYFIDVIVFFPAFFTNEDRDSNVKEMKKLLNTIEKKKQSLMAISSGNLTLIEETVKLIVSVMEYQNLVSAHNYNVESSILKVRGNMLKNSVTQTVYFNYLGLYYNKKAMSLLRKSLKLENEDLLSIKGLILLNQNIDKLMEEDLELLSIYLNESKKHFQIALEKSNQDVMWEGFIRYNEARTTFYLETIFPTNEEIQWKKMMDKAIVARKKMNLIIKDTIKNNNVSFLQEHFLYQEYIARLVKFNLLLAMQEDITDTRGNVKYPVSEYKKLLEEEFIKEPYDGPFGKVRDYKVEAREYLVDWE